MTRTRLFGWLLVLAWLLLTGWLLLITWRSGDAIILLEAGSAPALVWLMGLPIIWVLAWWLSRPVYALPPEHLQMLIDRTGEPMIVCHIRQGVIWRNAAAARRLGDDDSLSGSVQPLVDSACNQQSTITGTIVIAGLGRCTAQALPLNRQHSALIIQPPDSRNNRSEFYENFIQRIVHDMRNPLAAIIGHASNLDAAPEAEQIRHSAQTIEHEARRLARLVDSMLFDARLAYVPLAPEQLDLNELVEQAMFTLEDLSGDSESRIVLELPVDLVPFQGDRDLLVRAFENLLDNALKYMGDDGQVTVRLESEPSVYRLSFIDNGRGIAPEFLPDRIFEPLVRATKGGGGSGLGLSIVRRIITMHGGSVTAESTLGEGTVITVTLPRPAGGPF